jgi:hypothetical protein
VLTKMLSKASRERLVIGLLGNFRPGGVLTLQYVDNTVLFSAANNDSLRNLKCVLMLFEQVWHENNFSQK